MVAIGHADRHDRRTRSRRKARDARVRRVRHRAGGRSSRAAVSSRVARPRLRRRDGLSRALRRAPRRRARSVVPSARTRHRHRHASTTPIGRIRPSAPIPARAQIARYAWGDDYHDVIGARLDALLAWMRDAVAEPFEARAYVDTGPVQERVYAQHAGIGWIGKNTCVINPELGSWIFLGEIICSLPLDAGRAGARSVRHVHAVPRGVPDAGARRAGRARRDALHLVPDDRASRRHPGGAAARASARTSTAATSARKSVRGTQSAPRSADPAWQPRAAWDRVDLLTLSRRATTS